MHWGGNIRLVQVKAFFPAKIDLSPFPAICPMQLDSKPFSEHTANG